MFTIASNIKEAHKLNGPEPESNVQTRLIESLRVSVNSTKTDDI